MRKEGRLPRTGYEKKDETGIWFHELAKTICLSEGRQGGTMEELAKVHGKVWEDELGEGIPRLT